MLSPGFTKKSSIGVSCTCTPPPPIPLLLSQSQREDFLFPPPPPSHTSRPPSFQTSHRLSSSPLSILPFSRPTFLSPAASPLYFASALLPTFLFIVSLLAIFSLSFLSLDQLLAGYSCNFFYFFLPGKQLKEARLGPPEILIPFQSLPCCQKRLQKRQIRRLKNTFSPFFPLFQFYYHSTNTGKLHDTRQLLLKIQHRESKYFQFSQKLKSRVLLL